MPSLKTSVPHQLPQAEARVRIQQFLTELRAGAGASLTDLHETWTETQGDASFKFMGFSFKARIDVRPTTVDFDLTFPLAGIPFKGKVESKIRETASQLLSRG